MLKAEVSKAMIFKEVINFHSINWYFKGVVQLLHNLETFVNALRV